MRFCHHAFEVGEAVLVDLGHAVLVVPRDHGGAGVVGVAALVVEPVADEPGRDHRA